MDDWGSFDDFYSSSWDQSSSYNPHDPLSSRHQGAMPPPSSGLNNGASSSAHASRFEPLNAAGRASKPIDVNDETVNKHPYKIKPFDTEITDIAFKEASQSAAKETATVAVSKFKKQAIIFAVVSGVILGCAVLLKQVKEKGDMPAQQPQR